MNPIDSNFAGKWPEHLPWEGLVAVIIKMTGSHKLTLTAAGIEAARELRLDVTQGEAGSLTLEVARTVPTTKEAA